MKNLAKILAVAVVASAISAQAANTQNNNFYVEVDGGYSACLKREFKEEDVTGRLKGSSATEAKIGYSFYPNIALELSYAYKPSYKLDTKFHNERLDLLFSDVSSATPAKSQVMTAGLVYTAQDLYGGFVPYFSVGAGVGKVSLKKQTLIDATLRNSDTKISIGKVPKIHSTNFAWRVGAGILSGEIIPNLQLTANAKMEVIHNVKLEAEFPGIPKQSLKKTIGVGEFSLGLRYNI